ncbi:MAG: DegV family protein [Lachnoclostridium sp.]|jgi:DegV family protein with EDD domain|nr:DegV family protein [Lachnoclostridium sp.]
MVRIITDSLSDFTPEFAKELNVDLMPLSVSFGEETYLSGYEITNEEFYEKLVSSDVLPTSSQINPFEFEKKFNEYLEQGDDIVAVLFPKELSGTYQSAVIAKENIGSDRIHLIDCRSASMAQGVLVSEAAKMRDEGASAEEIETKILELTKRARLFIVLDTLEYVKKGGRISPSVAFVGGILGLHPVISVIEGKVDLVDKVKGKKSMNKWLLNKLEELPVDTNYNFYLGHSNAVDKVESFAELIKDREYGKNIKHFCIAPIVGTHVGPNAIGMGYISKDS